ncbi:MAG: hypothetical protein HZB66_02240 [Candidatus Aenigmarchaeota archaeon]|nr:hypothetical protein [Candidatus Aenigmarchaeota archaeon]
MPIMCQKCGKSFSDAKGLRKHSRKIHAVNENNDIALLRQGHIPEMSKIGQNFKGKNKIIIS